MSYHFHELRRRRAAALLKEAARTPQEVVEPPVAAESVEVKEEPAPKAKAVKKAVQSRRKGDA